jgi:hypothetical protein
MTTVSSCIILSSVCIMSGSREKWRSDRRTHTQILSICIYNTQILSVCLTGYRLGPGGHTDKTGIIRTSMTWGCATLRKFSRKKASGWATEKRLRHLCIKLQLFYCVAGHNRARHYRADNTAWRHNCERLYSARRYRAWRYRAYFLNN